jgi:hypothetical protein
MEGGRPMSVRETMTYPFTEGWKSLKARFGESQSGGSMTVPAE